MDFFFTFFPLYYYDQINLVIIALNHIFNSGRASPLFTLLKIFLAILCWAFYWNSIKFRK